jgi:hypothetical protein
MRKLVLFAQLALKRLLRRAMKEQLPGAPYFAMN